MLCQHRWLSYKALEHVVKLPYLPAQTTQQEHSAELLSTIATAWYDNKLGRPVVSPDQLFAPTVAVTDEWANKWLREKHKSSRAELAVRRSC